MIIIHLLYMDNSNKGINNIRKLYDNLNYFDQFGGSVVLFIIITIILLLFIGACFAFMNVKFIRDDWVNQRCKPYIIPIAGIINKPPDMSVKDFTDQNFTYCSQDIVKNISGVALQPLTYTTNILSSVGDAFSNSINDIRGMTDKIRNFSGTFTEEVMGRLMNVSIPLQQIIISVRDFIGKIQGTMTASLFTALGSYLSLKSLLGAIVQIIVEVLIALAVLIAIFWLFPFTWGTAVTGTALFVAAAIPLALIMNFMSKVLGINTGLAIPGLKSVKCFDKNTEFFMLNGTIKKMYELQVGDKLFNNSSITAKIIVETIGSEMYNLNGVIVSDSHIVKYKDNWIRVDQHPESIKLNDYQEPYLYCINTDNKIIELNGNLFTDWDEITDEDLEKIKSIKIKNVKYNFDTEHSNICNQSSETVIKNSDIHKYLDGGFHGDTTLTLKNGCNKKIKNIQICDVLENGEKVYGIVEIDGINLIEQASYNLAKNCYINGGCNLNICDKTRKFTSTLDLDVKNKKINTNHNTKLYHLLTNTKTFYVNGFLFYDYNSCIDLFLEKHRVKLLSMKYV